PSSIRTAIIFDIRIVYRRRNPDTRGPSAGRRTSTGAAGRSPRRRSEVGGEQPEHHLVHPASLDEHLLAAPALHPKADARVHAEPSFIGRVAGEADLVKVERLERVTAEQADRLGAEAASPAFLAADDDAERRVPVDGVDRVQPAVADVLLVLARHDREDLIARRVEPADVLARARLGVRPAADAERAPHLGVVEPGVANRRVILLERPEVDLRPDQVGVPHEGSLAVPRRRFTVPRSTLVDNPPAARFLRRHARGPTARRPSRAGTRRLARRDLRG